MYEALQKKVVNVAEKHADLVEKIIDESMSDGKVDSSQLDVIGDGIRLLNHAAATLYKLSACEVVVSPQTPNQGNDCLDDMPFA